MYTYEVTFKHFYRAGDRLVSFYVILDDSDLMDAEGEKQDPSIRAVEYAMPKFFKEYVLLEGSKLEVASVKEVV